MKTDEYFMQRALTEARKAAKKGEWPVGCILEMDGKIIAQAHNLSHQSKDKLAHAEILALQKADKILRKNYQKATLYTTCEPCPMCIGACLIYKIKIIVAGADPDNNGGFEILEHLPKYYYQKKFALKKQTGILEKECLEIFQKYHPKKIKSL